MAAAPLSETGALRVCRSPGATPCALGALSGAVAAALLWLGPPGNDTAAHVYQRGCSGTTG